MIENIAITFADILLNDINKIINDTKRENKMLNEIWEGIINSYATDEEILMFLDAYEESEGYEILSDKALSDYAIFKKVVTEELAISKPGPLLYHCIRNVMYGFGTNLSK